jgi:DNA-binding beta-propeller fold protein YncE
LKTSPAVGDWADGAWADYGLQVATPCLAQQFPKDIAFGPDGALYVADSMNNRIQKFDRHGHHLGTFGERGDAPGRFNRPFDVAIDSEGYVYVVENGNHRVQKLTPDGRSVAIWGGPGRGEGQLLTPWAVEVDETGLVTVADRDNHRLVQFRF